MGSTQLTDATAVDRGWEGLYGLPPDVELEEVLWRIDSKGFESASSETGWVARYVPYLNSAVVARLMDRWVGPLNWRDVYEDGTLAGRPVLWCHVEVRGPDPGEWVRKSDAGVAPSTSGASGRGEGMAEKGIVSDAFKRTACLKWGAGRNVYDLPTVWGPVHLRQNDPEKPTAPHGVEAALIAQLRAKGLEVDSARTDTSDAADLSPDAAPTGPQEPAHACPHCGSPVLDQRAKAKADPDHKTPSWKCRNQRCGGGTARKNPRPGDVPNWPWASWDPDEFTAPAGEAERANWDAKRRILERASGIRELAADAWAEAVTELGETTGTILGPAILAQVEELAARIIPRLLEENARIEIGPPDADALAAEAERERDLRAEAEEDARADRLALAGEHVDPSEGSEDLDPAADHEPVTYGADDPARPF